MVTNHALQMSVSHVILLYRFISNNPAYSFVLQELGLYTLSAVSWTHTLQSLTMGMSDETLVPCCFTGVVLF